MMNQLIPKAILISVGALLVAGAANAVGPPSWPNSDRPVGVKIVGTNGVVPDPKGNAVFVIRDAANALVGGVEVKIDFSGCPHVKLCAAPQRFDAITVCLPPTVSTMTDPSGVAVFSITGQYNPLAPVNFPEPDPVTPPKYDGCATVTVTVPGFPPTAYPYPNLVASVMNVDGFAGLTAGDLSIMVADRFANNYRERTDHDGSGPGGGAIPPITGGDLSEALDVVLGGGSFMSCGMLCP